VSFMAECRNCLWAEINVATILSADHGSTVVKVLCNKSEGC